MSIDWVVEKSFSSLIDHHPHINRVLQVDTRSWRKLRGISHLLRFRQQIRSVEYDAVFDLQGNSKSALVLSLARSRHKVGFGHKSIREWPGLLFTHHKYNFPVGLNVRQKYQSLLQSYFSDDSSFKKSFFLYDIDEREKDRISQYLTISINQELKIMICPGANWKNKRLDFSTWEKLLSKISSNYSSFFYLVWGTEEEKKQAEKLHEKFPDFSIVVDKLALPVWQRLMDKMDFILAVDSSALHLAATTPTPTFSFFGPTKGSIFAPSGLDHHFVQGKCPYHQQFAKQCPLLRQCSTGACMKNFDLDDIYCQLSNWLQSKSKSM